MASIAVIGAGAVGGYYGALLARAGHDVRFLMRSDLQAVKANGLDVRSISGNFRLPVVAAVATPEEIGPVDWVICSLKATALERAEALVAPCLRPDTRIVALMNGLGIEDRFAEWFGGQKVFGGMAFVCINRGQAGVIHHLEYGRVSIGHYEGNSAELDLLRALLESAAIEVAVAPNLRYARWEKLCWNIPFNGLSVAGGGIGTQAILGDSVLEQTARRAMREVVEAGNADLAAAGATVRLDGEEIVGRMFGLTATMGDYRTSMVIDYVLGRELEVEAILGEPFRRAQALGVEAATIGALYAAVRAADLRIRGALRPIAAADLLADPSLV
jgi:2-dehydropantoate 2-reductase